MDVVHRMLTGLPLVGTMAEVFIFEQRQPDDVLTGADTVWLARSAEASRVDLINQVLYAHRRRAHKRLQNNHRQRVGGGKERMG